MTCTTGTNTRRLKPVDEHVDVFIIPYLFIWTSFLLLFARRCWSWRTTRSLQQSRSVFFVAFPQMNDGNSHTLLARSKQTNAHINKHTKKICGFDKDSKFVCGRWPRSRTCHKFWDWRCDKPGAQTGHTCQCQLANCIFHWTCFSNGKRTNRMWKHMDAGSNIKSCSTSFMQQKAFGLARTSH